MRNVNLKSSEYNVTDKFPPEVKDRRKQLIPLMIEARRQGKRAELVRDKLYINNVLNNSVSGPVLSWNVEGLNSCINDNDFITFVSDFYLWVI